MGWGRLEISSAPGSSVTCLSVLPASLTLPHRSCQPLPSPLRSPPTDSRTPLPHHSFIILIHRGNKLSFLPPPILHLGSARVCNNSSTLAKNPHGFKILTWGFRFKSPASWDGYGNWIRNHLPSFNNYQEEACKQGTQTLEQLGGNSKRPATVVRRFSIRKQNGSLRQPFPE